MSLSLRPWLNIAALWLAVIPYPAGCQSAPARRVSSNEAHSSHGAIANPNDPLSEFLKQSSVSPKLFLALKDWGALPEWLLPAQKLHDDWVESFHKNSLNKTWPLPMRKAIAKTLKEPGTCLARSSTSAHEQSIIFCERTPVYLREIQEIVLYPLVNPDSSDPNANMLLDPVRKQEASRRLGLMLGMLEETSYLDGVDSEWNGGVRFGSHFIYYHELGHLAVTIPGSWPPIEIRPEEEEFAEEIRADQIAMAMLATELKNQPKEVIFAGFEGISVAMSFMAGQEFVQPYKKDLRSIKGAVFRMARLKQLTSIAVQRGLLPAEALTGLQFYWDLFTDLLRDVRDIPTPVFDLIQKTTDRPQKDWIEARSEIVKWCAFGDPDSVIAIIVDVYRDALRQASSKRQARRAVSVVNFLLDQTTMLEPELGLRAAIGPMTKNGP